MTETRSDRLRKVHERAIRRFDTIWANVADERRECLEDRRFYSIRGAQWDDDWGTQFENAPRMEVNKTHASVMRIISDYRNNRITVDFRPKDGSGDPETADTLDGLYRADEDESCAQEAYDTAFEEGVGGGFGAWRLRACYEDESDKDNEHQRIRFEPVADADQRVFFDPNAKLQDKSDGQFAFLLTPMSPEAYADEHGDDPSTWPEPANVGFEWSRPDVVWVAEYFEVEEKTSLKVTLTLELPGVPSQEQVLFDPDQAKLDELEVQGWQVERRRKVKQPRVHKYVLSGQEVLDDEGLIAGRHIPIVPYYGKRWYVNGIERCAGHVRYAKDPQRIYNAQVSQLAEIAAAGQHERPIFTPEQVAGHEKTWAEGNIKRLPYQLVNPLTDDNGQFVQTGPVGKVDAPQVPQALAASIQLSGADIAELTGSNEQLNEVPANTSAQAIELVHTRADAKTFIYLDNMAKALKRCGQIWLGMVGDLYVEEKREMQTLSHDGQRSMVKLAEPGLTNDGAEILRNDFTKGKFDVTVDVGPASSTRRDATVRSLIGMAQGATDPELQNVLLSTAMINMDGEGIDDVQKWLRMRLVRQGVIDPTDEEKAALAKEAENVQPDPQAALIEAATAQAGAEAKKAEAGTIKTLAEVELTKAKTGEIMAKVDGEHPDQVLSAVSEAAKHLPQQFAAQGGGIQ